ncbi:ladderlectin-like isoform X1 [Perca flavescens]|uniref:ladderlectin-like isoform X1 n=1 Tax=Perca flavescens TaxID=8167 RepID=UPI00106EDCAE|nr:ladderlectin-like isoform X1 [Perca flavescens]
MKMLTVAALLCAMMALTRAAAFKEAEATKDLIVKSHLVKRATSCPSGWSEVNGRCFQYFPTAMTWAKAEKNCQSLGGNLASVHNIFEYREIQRIMATTLSIKSKEAWIGGTDAQEEGVWLWSDSSLFSYQNWCPGEPSNWRGSQHCLQMNFGEGKCWDDVGCSALLPFVCSKKI